MNEFMLSCKNIVLSNIKNDVDEEVVEILTIATMGLVLSQGKMALERLPKIFQELDIYAEHKPVIDIAHEKLNNYSEDAQLCHSDAAVTRSLGFDDDTMKFEKEKRSLIMSLSALHKDGIINVIEKVTHELIHLMRFGGVQDGEKITTIKDGISSGRFYKENHSIKRKHYNLEEGIVQFYTLESLKSLYDFIENEDVSESTYLSLFKKGYKKHNFVVYIFQVGILKTLCTNSRFRELLDYTFEEESSPSQLALYFNDVMGDGSAFTCFSKHIDTIVESVISENSRIPKEVGEALKMDIVKFITLARKK